MLAVAGSSAPSPANIADTVGEPTAESDVKVTLTAPLALVIPTRVGPPLSVNATGTPAIGPAGALVRVRTVLTVRSFPTRLLADATSGARLVAAEFTSIDVTATSDASNPAAFA